MERKTLAKGLVVSALACFGFVLAMGSAQAEDATRVQGTQSAVGAGAATGPAVGGNFSGFAGGPTAVAGAGASSQQLGSNRATVRQSGDAKTGDPVAGGQVTGVVGDNANVQNSNSALGTLAVSGPAGVVNATAGALGPAAVSIGPAQAGQSGSNSLDLRQSGNATTGDAVSGGQITGIVGAGEHTVQNQNSCVVGCIALSTPAVVANLNAAGVGPFAASVLPAQTGQVGNNDAVITQTADAHVGDAVAGSEVTGIVGGSATVQQSNNCGLICVAATLPAVSFNASLPVVGPTALSVVSAQTSQGGNNTATLAQSATGTTGDAVSGSQVTGWVGDQNGFLTVMNQQAGQGEIAFSGTAIVGNVGIVPPGPFSLGLLLNAQSSQTGDNVTVVAQDANGSSGDALAGSQVTGGVGGDMTISHTNSAIGTIALSNPIVPVIGFNAAFGHSGPTALGLLTSGSSQFGSNATSLDQRVKTSSGDAVSGGQVVGAVSSGDVRVMASNSALATLGVSGGALGGNGGTALAGPASAGALSAQSQQTGRNTTAHVQATDVSTGDALSGAQTVGAVADGDVTVSAQNSAILTLGISGVALGGNAGFAFAGPFALSGLNANTSQLGDNVSTFTQVVSTATGDAVSGGQVVGAVSGGDVTIQAQSNALLVAAVSLPSAGLNVGASQSGSLALALIGGSSSQTGNNGATYNQTVNATTGDAVAGAQVAGAVADGDVTVSASNSAIGTVAITSPSAGANVGVANAGPVVLAALLNANAQQSGNNTVVQNQAVNVATGDAVSGSEVIGAVSGGDVRIMSQNGSLGTLSIASSSFGFNFGLPTAGPAAVNLLSANVSQFGNNVTILGQTVNSTSGDAVSGSQITGAVADDDVTIMGSNSAVAAFSVGLVPSVGINAGAAFSGPRALAGVIGSTSQFGDNRQKIDQLVNVATGDAVAGSQVAGVVANGDVTVSNQNSSIGTLALSRSAIGLNGALSFAGPIATGALAAQAQQAGDNSLDYTQNVAVTTGDAIAGSQVTGVVGAVNANVQVGNSDLLSFAFSGIPAGFNASGGALTPTALSIVSARVQTSGDSALTGQQDLISHGGDAVSGGQINGGVGTGGAGGARPLGRTGIAGVTTP